MIEILTIATIACFMGLIFCAIMACRNNTVYKVRIRLIQTTSADFYDKTPDYNHMMNDFLCWTEKGFISKYGD